MQKHVERILREWDFWKDVEYYSRKWRDNITVCSCENCRNPRRSGWSSNKDKLTIQERKKQVAT